MNNFLLQWNCRGLLSKWPECRAFFSTLSPAVIALQETWCLSTDTHSFRLDGYSLYRSDYNGEGRRRGGVALYISNSIPQTQVNIPHFEINTLICTIKTQHKLIDIICIYIPPHITANEIFHHLNTILTYTTNPILLVGDFNAHHTQWGNAHTDDKGTMLETFLRMNTLIYLNDGSPTYHNLSTGNDSSIDLSICSPCLAPQFQWSVGSDIRSSDHYPIFLSTPRITNPTQWIQKMNFNRADWLKFKNLCAIEP